jgi:hypothetical protein
MEVKGLLHVTVALLSREQSPEAIGRRVGGSKCWSGRFWEGTNMQTCSVRQNVNTKGPRKIVFVSFSAVGICTIGNYANRTWSLHIITMHLQFFLDSPYRPMKHWKAKCASSFIPKLFCKRLCKLYTLKENPHIEPKNPVISLHLKYVLYRAFFYRGTARRIADGFVTP